MVESHCAMASHPTPLHPSIHPRLPRAQATTPRRAHPLERPRLLATARRTEAVPTTANHPAVAEVTADRLTPPELDRPWKPGDAWLLHCLWRILLLFLFLCLLLPFRDWLDLLWPYPEAVSDEIRRVLPLGTLQVSPHGRAEDEDDGSDDRAGACLPRDLPPPMTRWNGSL